VIAPTEIFPYTSPIAGVATPPWGFLFIAGIMQSFDFKIVLDCPLDTVFSIYVDVDRWRNRSLFGVIRWVHGKPWEEGSRLRIEVLKPIRADIDQVVQHFAPKESVSYLSHVLGITCETRVIFASVSVTQTAISVVMNLVGTTSRALGFALAPAILKATKGYFEELRKECEAAAHKSAGT
jgi:hypothetical protein